MKAIYIFILLIITNFTNALYTDTEELLSSPTDSHEIWGFFRKVSRGAVYFGMGTFFKASSDLAELGWGVCQLSPWASTIGQEFFLFSQLCRLTLGLDPAQVDVFAKCLQRIDSLNGY